MNKLDDLFALIMAGGKGTRLWPLATDKRPKAFLCFDNSGLSLLQRTIIRLSGLIPLENIFIVAAQAHSSELYKQAYNIPERNIILEPVNRSTLPCIGLASLYIRKRNDSGVIIILPGEQLIGDDKKFQNLVFCATKAAAEFNSIITLGIKPDYPATKFGYIQSGDNVPQTACLSMYSKENLSIYKALKFVEKPDKQKAAEFLSSGRYFWNSGIFILPIKLLFELISINAPDLDRALSMINEAIDKAEEKEVIQQIYPKVNSISIDYAIMERSENILVMPAHISWNDMGTWPEVSETWEKDDQENACFGKHIGIDSTGCIIYSPGKLVTTIGLENVIIVETPDSVLVCAKDRADDVKKLVQKMEEGF